MLSYTDSIALPCGAVAPNRLLKSACTEGLANPDNRVTERHLTLYRLWALSGAGILVSGNILVDRRYLERGGNVSIDKDYPYTYDVQQRAMLKAWGEVSKSGGSLFLAQLNCAGLKSPDYVTPRTIGPVGQPKGTVPNGATQRKREDAAAARAVTVEELDSLVEKWVFASTVLAECGWDGVQIHAAHGYLVSSFLSPYVNTRTDAYGGSLDNRARLLLRILEGIREAVPDTFVVSVKIHCSDFADNGFTYAECTTVCRWLVERGIDLIEFSGAIGTIIRSRRLGEALVDQLSESAITADPAAPRSAAWFTDHCTAIRGSGACVKVPTCMTGGFTLPAEMDDALRAGTCDMLGMGRPFCVAPADVGERLQKFDQAGQMEPIEKMPEMAGILWYYHQFQNIGDGKPIDWEISIQEAAEKQMAYHASWGVEYKKTISNLATTKSRL